jgi:hypothetical protein
MRQLKIVADNQQESKMRGSEMSRFKDEHKKNRSGVRRGGNMDDSFAVTMGSSFSSTYIPRQFSNGSISPYSRI